MRLRASYFLILPFLIGACIAADMTQPQASQIMGDIVFALQTDGLFHGTSRSFDAAANAKELERVNKLLGSDFRGGSTTIFIRTMKQPNRIVYLWSVYLKKTGFTYLARLDVVGDRAVRFTFD